ncbi:hypothetical protein P4S64_00910 [Vibrio sp. M60_M31a]
MAIHNTQQTAAVRLCYLLQHYLANVRATSTNACISAELFTNEQKQATWFLFQLSKELSELVGEARRLDEDIQDINGAELQYELAWSRFDLLINSVMMRTHFLFSQQYSAVFFRTLQNNSKTLSLFLSRRAPGRSSGRSPVLSASTQTLYLDLVDFVNQNFRLTSKV